MTPNTRKSLENMMLKTKGSTLCDPIYTVCLDDLWRHKMDLRLTRAGLGRNQWYDLTTWGLFRGCQIRSKIIWDCGCPGLWVTTNYGSVWSKWWTVKYSVCLKVKTLTPKLSIFMNLWVQHVPSGVQRELQMEQKTGEGISRLTDNPTLPHGAAPKLTFCLSPAWLVAVCLRGSHYESKLTRSSQQFTNLTSMVHTTTPTALFLHLLHCGEKTSQMTGNCRGRGMIRSEVQIKWERRRYPTECPSQW